MSKYIGDKKFYKMVLAIAVPMILQFGITNFVSLLDNIMIGRVGTEQMTAVAIVNQIIVVYNMCIFGAVSGASIFGAQFFGKGSIEGLRDTFRFKFLSFIAITLIFIAIFLGAGNELIGLFLSGNDLQSLEMTRMYGNQYMLIIIISTIPGGIIQCYSSTLREMGKTVVPMVAGFVALFINVFFNYILIYGKLGMPVLGVKGAAIATVLAKMVECLIVVIYVQMNLQVFQFAKGAFRSFKIPGSLVKDIIAKGMPLLINETMWSAGMAALLQCYSVRGLNVVAGMNIATTVSNMFNVVFSGIGSSVAIIIGQLLGAGKMEEAKDNDRKLIFFSVSVSVVVGAILFALAPIFPNMYKTNEEVKYLAVNFLRILAMSMPLIAFTHASYFTLRSGGKTIITFLFDSVFVWVVSVSCAYVLANHTSLNIILVYFICQFTEIIKCTIGFILVKKGVWIQNVVSEK